MLENIIPIDPAVPVGAGMIPPAVIPSAVEGSQGNKFPLLTTILLILLSLAATLAIYLFLQFRTMTLEKLTPSPTPSPIASADVAPTPNPDPNIKTFTSQKLGISFQYQEKYKGSDETIMTKEIGSKVYVYSSNISDKPEEGQYVEVFNKEPNDFLSTAIEKIIMPGYSTSDCIIAETLSTNITGSSVVLPESYRQAVIKVPINDGDDISDIGLKAEKCPRPYTSVGGLAYFFMDLQHPAKFAFFSIGQYALNAGDNITWEDTFKFVEQ